MGRVGDERLVERVQAGDDDAFEAIYDRYYLGLLAFCRHMLGSRQDAEDALQHSFAAAYRALRRGDSAVDLRPWLYTIARNRCLSALRSRRDELDIDRADVDRASFDGLPFQIQLRAELRELVEDVRRLPDDQRAALVLFELGDHSHEEIAAVLEVRREKVKALVFQARAGLLRARRARDTSCVEIREQLATAVGAIPKRGTVRAHVDRCEACAAFERQVRRQRKALAVILPVVPTAGLKASVLGFALGGGGGAAAITGVTVGGGAAAGGGAVAGALGTAGVATVAGGFVASTNIAPGLSALGAKGLMTKILTVVAVAGGGGEARQASADTVAAERAAATVTRAPMVAHAKPAVRHHAPGKAVAHRAPARPSAGEPADAPAQQSIPPPEAAHADETPAPAAAPLTQHASTQPAATATPTPTPDPQPAPVPAAPDPEPAPAPAEPEATATTTTTETDPAASTTSTATSAPTATATEPDPSPTAPTLSTTETPAASAAPAAAAAEAQN